MIFLNDSFSWMQSKTAKMSSPPEDDAPVDVAEVAAAFTKALPERPTDGQLYWVSHSRYLLIVLANIWLKTWAISLILKSKNSNTKMNSLHTESIINLF